MDNKDTFNFNIALKTFPQSGNLVYEYNPFHNYRLDHSMIFYKNLLMEFEDFCKEVRMDDSLKEAFLNGDLTSFNGIISPNEAPPIVYLAGLLVNFETSELKFDLSNPVNITPQWSYDNSVNLIINDGKNLPRLINSRFSPTERNKYLICDRLGNNDSNIYDLGVQFDIDTSLYKKINTIPSLKFIGVSHGGNLSIGNYHFYFKYVDDDGNESDFFAESGLVSIFIGNSANSIHSGFRDENSYKLVKFILTNVDPGYSKVIVYYTRVTSDIHLNAITLTKKILFKYDISNSAVIVITGYEDTEEVTTDDLNMTYLIYGSVETQETALNMLFLGNVDRPNIPYLDLADCALRFLPVLDFTEQYNVDQLGEYYSGSNTNTYYDPNYIYNKVGYWDDEYYRLGIVFILSDNTLTLVFNTRGAELNKDVTADSYLRISFIENENRKYISYNEDDFRIISDDTVSKLNNENSRGVVYIDSPEFKTVTGLNFAVSKEVINYLKNKLNIKGYFFVRQKRIPTTLCLAYTIGIDKESKTPVLNTKDGFIAESFLDLIKDTSLKPVPPFYKPRINPNFRTLTNDLTNRLVTLKKLYVRELGAICPEYDINSEYLNTLFSGLDLVYRPSKKSQFLNLNGNLFLPQFDFEKSYKYGSAKIIGVEDNTKLVAIQDNMFSARAGEAEEASKFEYIGKEEASSSVSTVIRGSFGPYLGIVGMEESSGYLIDIKIPEYSVGKKLDYFKIRYNDLSLYYAISDRYGIDTLFNELGDFYLLKNPVYRGDCYICLFTHRVNRNFLDPSSPTNDKIVDPKCWKNNFEISDGVVNSLNFEKINLGDLNAVLLGLFVTLVVRSTFNLNIRSLDSSVPDEESLFGHPRGFFPYYPISTAGNYKIQEALCINKGLLSSLSEKYNFLTPDVPWIKNEFSNRIAYSNVQILDAFLNGWRTFPGTYYRDYPKTYGSITKLVELRGNLVCVFEHGVGLIPVNERALAGEGSGGNVFINTSNVLPENPKIISDTFGSLWRDSIIKTPRAIYGVDAIAKKIWRTNGETFECISDFKVLEFLNLNISLTERENTPIIGIRNIKTHYNKFKGDVMFTFYDNLHGFEEKVWNLCYNELLQKWITFYSWVPSYSENIYNQYFSFDRNTSKWIAKLGISNAGNDFSDGVVLSNNTIPNNAKAGHKIGELSLENRTLPSGDGVRVIISYVLEKDNFENYKNFRIGTESGKYYLYLNTDASNLCSELYVRGTKSGNKYIEIITDPITLKESWLNNCIYSNKYCICKDDRGRSINLGLLPYGKKLNENKLVYLLNIKAKVTVRYTGETNSIAEYYVNGFTNGTEVDAGYYLSTVAVIPLYNIQFLTTDFWKHGLAGIIDISDKILPTYWYGKQHPFELEFVVADNPQLHKIFDNLEIISNNAEPESFHYEIVGDCYEFSKDKKNMYIRLEATKELYLNNGYDVLYDHDYINLKEILRPLVDTYGKRIRNLYDKSTLFPLYYSRLDTFNDIEDYYHLKDNIPTKNFSALAGAEIVKYENLDEYRIWNHSKAVDVNSYLGRLRGNMQYKEDKWDIQINPINLVLRNEPEWREGLIPIELGLSPLPDKVLEYSKYNNGELNIPENSKNRDVVIWKWQESNIKEVKPKDKWIKIRIRYNGKKLAIISAIRTLYSISYA